jgi:hypothetical protein
MTTAATEVVTYQMFINGEWVDAASGQTFDSMNPYTGKAWAQMPDAQEEDVCRPGGSSGAPGPGESRLEANAAHAAGPPAPPSGRPVAGQR